MHNQNHTILLAKLAACAFIAGIFVPLLAQFKANFPLRRLSVGEGILLTIVVVAGTIWCFQWVVRKHFKDLL